MVNDMETTGAAVLKRIGFKTNGKPSIMLSMLAGKDQHGKAKYVNVLCTGDTNKTNGFFETEKELKAIQSQKPDATLLCDVSILNMTAYFSECKNFINHSGYLLDIKKRERKA